MGSVSQKKEKMIEILKLQMMIRITKIFNTDLVKANSCNYASFTKIELLYS